MLTKEQFIAAIESQIFQWNRMCALTGITVHGCDYCGLPLMHFEIGGIKVSIENACGPINFSALELDHIPDYDEIRAAGILWLNALR